MNAKEFIEKYLQNCTYGNELSEEAEAAARENNLVVVFGASDDLCELRGAIGDEIGCYDGGEIITGTVAFEAVWHDDGNYSWTYDADFPHEEFDVMEDGEKYCRGMVFALSDVKKRSKTKTYGDVFDEFLNVTKIDKETINDYRPCEPPYYANPIANAIIVWLKNGGTLIYIASEEDKD